MYCFSKLSCMSDDTSLLLHMPSLLTQFLRQAVGQLCSTASMAHNLQQCQILIRKAAVAKAKVSLLDLVIKAVLCLSCIGNPENRGSSTSGALPPRSQRLHSLLRRRNRLPR